MGSATEISNSNLSHSGFIIFFFFLQQRLYFFPSLSLSPSKMANDFFSSLVSDIKAYTGQDPLHPWLRGIRKMKESLPPLILKEKLPRFLQKCAQTFQSDRRYRNDLRYLRVWIQLMDFVDDPRALLRTMEMNKIGTKQALFYQAYALYYEKLKNFEEADKMYHLGVQNLAQPNEELQKSYEQFLHRMEQHKRRKTRRQELKASMTARNNPSKGRDVEGTKKVVEGCSADMTRGQAEFETHLHSDHNLATTGRSSGIISDPSGSKRSYEPNTFCSDETVVVKFVDTAIVGKSEPEDACHHGLVDPTINLKEAMNAINSMFREPLELEPVHRRKSNRSQPKVDQKLSNGFEVFVDEYLDDGRVLSHENKENVCVPTIPGNLNPLNPITSKKHETDTKKPLQAAFEIFVDDEESNGSGDRNDDDNNNFHYNEHPMESSASQVSAFVFPTPRDLSCNGSDDQDVESSPHFKLIREDTVVGRFVGSTISDEPEVENACHHGLVDPTINLKEAMAAINNMFGKPIDYVRTNRPKKQAKLSDKKRDCSGFSILPDDNLEDYKQLPRASSCLPTKSDREIELFEPTVFTKQAMDDINEMFGKPLDF